MSYSNQFFGYANSFSLNNDDGDETALWHHSHQPHYVQMSQPTVDPFQVFDQSDAYDSPRSYNSDRRYHNTNRHNFGVTPGMEPLVIQHMSPTASAQRFNTYNAERQVRERPHIMVEGYADLYLGKLIFDGMPSQRTEERPSSTASTLDVREKAIMVSIVKTTIVNIFEAITIKNYRQRKLQGGTPESLRKLIYHRKSWSPGG